MKVDGRNYSHSQSLKEFMFSRSDSFELALVVSHQRSGSHDPPIRFSILNTPITLLLFSRQPQRFITLTVPASFNIEDALEFDNVSATRDLNRREEPTKTLVENDSNSAGITEAVTS